MRSFCFRFGGSLMRQGWHEFCFTASERMQVYVLRQKSVQRSVCNYIIYQWYSAETEIIQSESVLWHLRVAEGDHLSERSEGRKLPQHKTRALATQRKLKTLLGGCSGGAVRRAGVQTSPEGETPCPQGSKFKYSATER